MTEYIERKTAIKRVMETKWESGSDGAAAMEIVAATPAADVAPVVHGRWEQCFEDWRKQIEGDQCSVCGFAHYGTTIRDYNYCPNCGAKMDGGVDNA